MYTRCHNQQTVMHVKSVSIAANLRFVTRIRSVKDLCLHNDPIRPLSSVFVVYAQNSQRKGLYVKELTTVCCVLTMH
jgi:hypothetical protein